MTAVDRITADLSRVPLYEAALAVARADLVSRELDMKEAEAAGEWRTAVKLAIGVARLKGIIDLWADLIRWPPVPEEPASDEEGEE